MRSVSFDRERVVILRLSWLLTSHSQIGHIEGRTGRILSRNAQERKSEHILTLLFASFSKLQVKRRRAWRFREFEALSVNRKQLARHRDRTLNKL